MSDNEIVTVLLPVFNRRSVADTIVSVQRQSYSNFELLIIDNASTDGTYETLTEFACEDSRIRIVRNEKNMGQTYSLCKGLQLAKGRYIARIDADDLMHPDRLKKQVEYFNSHINCSFVGTWAQNISAENKLTVTVKMPITDRGIRVLQRVSCPMIHPSVMMRADTIKKYDLKYDASFSIAADYDLWRKLLLCGEGGNIPETLTYYRKGANTSNDSRSHADITRRESQLIRMNICSAEDYPGKQYIDEILQLEGNQKKSFIQMLRAGQLYEDYLQEYFMIDEEDYSIIQQKIKFKLLSEFIINNDVTWSKFLSGSYTILRNIYYRIIAKEVK